MTAALLDSRTAGANYCRFTWCAGSCKADTHPSGERNHWSGSITFPAYDVDERVAVELYEYENNEDGADPVAVYVAIGDDAFDEDGSQLTVSQARALGVALRDFAPSRPDIDMEDFLIHAVDGDKGERILTAEYRHERIRRDWSAQPAHVEFSMRPEPGRKHSIRVRLDLETARRFGRHLIGAADQADISNRVEVLGLAA